MRKVLPTVLAVLALGACDDDDDTPQDLQEWSTALVGQGLYPSVRGNSRVRQLLAEDGFTATINIEGDESGTRRAWYVRSGTCATGGDIVGDPDSYPALNVAGNGRASARVSIDRGRLVLGLPYHVSVHASPDQLETIVACGDLSISRDPDAGRGADAAADDAGPDSGFETDAGVTRDAGRGADASLPRDAATTAD
jgi:hypothetical protein